MIDTVKTALISDPVWVEALQIWTTSTNPRILLFTAYLLSVLLEQKDIGIKMIQQIGLDRLISLVDIIDIDVRHTVEHLFQRLEGLQTGRVILFFNIFILTGRGR